MSKRGLTKKYVQPDSIVLERPMVTRHYRMEWNLDFCVGCQIGPAVCPKDAILHVDGVVENGRLIKKPTIDVDADKCVFCGICAIMCPKNAISMTINDEPEIPVLGLEAFPNLIQSTTFDRDQFDWSKKDFVINNCPTHVISYDEQQDTMLVDDDHCIRCRQCEVASQGAFQVVQPWQGSVTLNTEKCAEGCLACADICPTRALHIDEQNQLVLADYYCIKCGACMQVCPIKAEYEETEDTFEAYGVTKTVKHKTLVNADELPVKVERWRVRHTDIKSGAWMEALRKMSDDKAGAVELDRKRALRRRDLLKALIGGDKILK
jgi:ferredoxin